MALVWTKNTKQILRFRDENDKENSKSDTSLNIWFPFKTWLQGQQNHKKSQEWYCSYRMSLAETVYWDNECQWVKHFSIQTLVIWALGWTQRQVPWKTKCRRKITKIQSRAHETWWHFTTWFFLFFFFSSSSLIMSLTSFYGDKNIFPFMASPYFIN